MNMQVETKELSHVSSTSLIMNGDLFDRIERIANLMASGRSTVPKHLQGNVADCFAVSMQAMRWNMDPFAVAQKTHLVNGTLGYEAQLVNAVLQCSGSVDGRPHYEYKGDGEGLECRVGFIISGENQITWSEWLTLNKVTIRNSPLWKANTKQQFGYLQIKNWARAFCPGAILGVYTQDELETISSEREINPVPESQQEPAGKLAYPDEAFNRNFDKWKVAIEKGTSTHDDWLKTINAKGDVTDAQLARIYEVKAPIQGEVVNNANS